MSHDSKETKESKKGNPSGTINLTSEQLDMLADKKNNPSGIIIYTPEQREILANSGTSYNSKKLNKKPHKEKKEAEKEGEKKKRKTNPDDKKLIVEKITKNALLPGKRKEDAGYDLFSPYDIIVPAWSKSKIKTELKITVPKGTYGRISSRSGLSVNHDIEVGAGTIDRGYRGEVIVVLRNFSDVDVTILASEKKAIAQLILIKIDDNAAVKEVEKLPGESVRGENGFGSTDQKELAVELAVRPSNREKVGDKRKNDDKKEDNETRKNKKQKLDTDSFMNNVVVNLKSGDAFMDSAMKGI